jgi:DDE superfamily endonuclease
MSTPIVPESFLRLLLAFGGCFQAASYRNFQVLMSGWIQCVGRHTITGVVIAAGAVGVRHISVFHRFFARAQWSLDAVGRVLCGLALAWVPADQPVYLLGDDTLTRRQGKGVSLAAMHHDPLLSHGRKPFFSFGHVWVVLALWVPLPMGQGRGFALPLLVRLYTSSKRGGRADAPARRTRGARQVVAERAHADRDRRTKLELLRELVGLVAQWAEGRTIYLVCDSAYAGRALLEGRPEGVHVISRLRLDAALWTVPPPRRRGRGRPRRRGVRLPTPKVLAEARRSWTALSVCLYGQTVQPQVFTLRALWYAALRDQPLRIVVVRDPSGRRQLDAFFCTDVTASPGFILEAYARRWSLEVTFHDSKQFLGLAEPQCQSPQAVQRTTPLAFVSYDLVLLWFAAGQTADQQPRWIVRPWYRHKTAPSFLDMLTALRQAGWQAAISAAASPLREPQKSAAPPRTRRKTAA